MKAGMLGHRAAWMMGVSRAVLVAACAFAVDSFTGLSLRPVRGWGQFGSPTRGRPGRGRRNKGGGSGCSTRAMARYARNGMHWQQRNSHNLAWQAVNPHMRQHFEAMDAERDAMLAERGQNAQAT